MGFSIASSNSFGQCYLIQNHRQRTGKQFASFHGNFKLSTLLTRVQSRKLFCCKLEGIDFQERTSPAEEKYAALRPFKINLASKFVFSLQVKEEIEQCYKLIQRLGRGVVYLGSSRFGPNHPHYAQAFELGKEIASFLDCTSWSGAGPGLMDAVTKGALQAGKPVGGFKIAKEAGEWTATNVHPYLPLDCYLTCRFFSARKHGLVDAAVRANGSDRTAVVALPGGIGTLDEAFEILALIQLQRIGSMLPVPFLLMNYDSFYSKLLDFLDDCEVSGTLSKGELASLWKVCNNNSEAWAYLEEYYSVPRLRNDYKTVTN